MISRGREEERSLPRARDVSGGRERQRQIAPLEAIAHVENAKKYNAGHEKDVHIADRVV